MYGLASVGLKRRHWEGSGKDNVEVDIVMPGAIITERRRRKEALSPGHRSEGSAELEENNVAGRGDEGSSVLGL